MRRLFTSMLFVSVLFVCVHACFDAFLFTRLGSMVYPKNTFAIEGFGEYSFNSTSSPENDVFLGEGRIFYGISDRLSMQIGFGSDEKPRGQFAFDVVSASGTVNILKRRDNTYSLDGIIACKGNIDNDELSFEVSAPSIFRMNKFVAVVHPVIELLNSDGFDATAGAHAGLFRVFDNSAVIGIGAEYRSGQGGPYFSKRIIDGEAATSLFLGAMIGKNLFIQNELAKGLSNSRDFGYAITLKCVFDLR